MGEERKTGVAMVTLELSVPLTWSDDGSKEDFIRALEVLMGTEGWNAGVGPGGAVMNALFIKAEYVDAGTDKLASQFSMMRAMYPERKAEAKTPGGPEIIEFDAHDVRYDNSKADWERVLRGKIKHYRDNVMGKAIPSTQEFHQLSIVKAAAAMLGERWPKDVWEDPEAVCPSCQQRKGATLVNAPWCSNPFHRPVKYEPLRNPLATSEHEDMHEPPAYPFGSLDFAEGYAEHPTETFGSTFDSNGDCCDKRCRIDHDYTQPHDYVTDAEAPTGKERGGQ